MKKEIIEREVTVKAGGVKATFTPDELKKILFDYAKENGVDFPDKVLEIKLNGLRNRTTRNLGEREPDVVQYLELIVMEDI